MHFTLPPSPAPGVVGHAADPNVRHRRAMEDTVAAISLSTLPALFVAVYDGHGGKAASELLSKHLHRYFIDALLSDDISSACTGSNTSSPASTPPYDITPQQNKIIVPTQPILDEESAFRAAYEKMDHVLRARRCVRTGATAVTCFVREDDQGKLLTTANCGDARAVLARAGRPLRLSEDHRPVMKEERKRVENAGGFVLGGRVNGVLNVSRAFGDHSMKAMVVSTPSVKTIRLGPLDEFLVLACDGLWDFVEEKDVIRVAREAFDKGMKATEVAGVIVKEAIKKGSTDNVSVVVVALEEMEE